MEDTVVLDTTNVSPEYQNSCAPPSWVSGPAAALAALCIQPAPEEETLSTATEQYLVGSIMSALAALDNDPWQDLSQVAPIRQQPTVISMSRLEAAAATCPTYSKLRSLIQSGPPEDKSMWPPELRPYHTHRLSLVVVSKIIMFNDRPVIPHSLRGEALEHLHGAHHCVTTMYARAVSCMYWPNMREDIVKTVNVCGLHHRRQSVMMC